MPFPVAHSLAGAAIRSAVVREPDRACRGGLLVAVVLANAPDLDLLPGLMIGDPNRFHHGWTHSLLTAALVGLLVSWLARRERRARLFGLGAGGTGCVVAALLGSHVLLDMLTQDLRAPFGVPALWPLVDAHFHLAPLFARAERLAGPGSPLEFFASMATAHTAGALVREMAIVAPVWAVVVWWRRRTRRNDPGPAS